MITRKQECWTFSGGAPTVEEAQNIVQDRIDKRILEPDFWPNLKVLHQSIAMSSWKNYCEVIVLLTVEFDEDDEEVEKS